MRGAKSVIFPGLFDDKPAFVRQLLFAALRVRALENLYRAAQENHPGELCPALLRQLHIHAEISDSDVLRIPASGPVIIVANHPFGLLDGLVLDSVLLRVRPDIKILTNHLLASLPELEERCLPIDVTSRHKRNTGSLRRAVRLLQSGQGLAFFPAGEVSHWQMRTGSVADSDWSTAPVRCSEIAKAPVVPLYFSGSNSLPFQFAGLLHPRLRTARLPGELLNKGGRHVEVRVGTAISSDELRRFACSEEATRYIRARTYALAHRKSVVARGPQTLSFPIQPKPKPVALGTPVEHLSAELERLRADGAVVAENSDYAVFAASGHELGCLMQEIARQREITFRAVGEGSGEARDMDAFDAYYTQLILWHKSAARIAGGYRLAWTSSLLPERGPSGLTSSADLRILEKCLDDVESLAATVSDLDDTRGIPVLLRQYLRLGGKVAGFNLNPKFSNALDGLLIVDLRETSPKMLARYMGRELAADFLARATIPRSA